MATLTSALEDYLETVYRLIKTRRVARVRDIAKARDVRAGSVSQALQRLADLGLVDYVQREYVELTPKGEQQARRIFARHQLLERFFHDVLQLTPKEADAEACSMEHSLSDKAMDRFVRFFEFLTVCSKSPPEFLDTFHRCSLMRSQESAQVVCQRCEEEMGEPHEIGIVGSVNLSTLDAGMRGEITRVAARGELRQRILDMGLLPGTVVEVTRVASDELALQIRHEQTALELDPAAAESIRVVLVDAEAEAELAPV